MSWVSSQEHSQHTSSYDNNPVSSGNHGDSMHSLITMSCKESNFRSFSALRSHVLQVVFRITWDLVVEVSRLTRGTLTRGTNLNFFSVGTLTRGTDLTVDVPNTQK